jgi:cytochrome c oxidase cbb3-type subunit III
MNRLLVCVACAACLVGLSVAGLVAGQDDGVPPDPSRAGGRGGRGTAQGAGQSTAVTTVDSFNSAEVKRGQSLFGRQCASCHGFDARGGSGKTDVDLLRQPVVLMDITGKQLGDFLKSGRPEKGMPKFDLTADQVSEISAFLRYEIAAFVADHGGERHNVFSGNSEAGEVFFNGSIGKCNTCHSVTGDLKGIGARTHGDAPTLQGAILSGSGGGRGDVQPNVTASVTLQDGQKFVGVPLNVNDWLVEIRLADGTIKSWLPNNGWPKVIRTNRLQAHVDLMVKYTDDDIHNLAAYLQDK